MLNKTDYSERYERYKYHGKEVFVNSKLKGKHRDHCLCFACSKFTPNNRQNNCEIANICYYNCVLFNIVTPVYECQSFSEKQKNR